MLSYYVHHKARCHLQICLQMHSFFHCDSVRNHANSTRRSMWSVIFCFFSVGSKASVPWHLLISFSTVCLNKWVTAMSSEQLCKADQAEWEQAKTKRQSVFTQPPDIFCPLFTCPNKVAMTTENPLMWRFLTWRGSCSHHDTVVSETVSITCHPFQMIDDEVKWMEWMSE